MNYILIFLILIFSLKINAQEDKTVTIIVTGQGKTQDEARQKALRDAIEQAYGSFISSKTKIINDSIIYDNIVSISNGTIKKYESISEIQIKDLYNVTLRVQVSLMSLLKIMKTTSGVAEINAEYLVTNIENEEQNTIAEEKIISTNLEILKEVMPETFDYKIVMGIPKLSVNNNTWDVPLKVSMISNKNAEQVVNYLINLFKEISLSQDKIKEYAKLNKLYFPVKVVYGSSTEYFYLRSIKSITLLDELLEYFLRYTNPNNFIIKRIYKNDSKYSNTELRSINNINIYGIKDGSYSHNLSVNASDFKGFKIEQNKEMITELISYFKTLSSEELNRILKSNFYKYASFLFCLNRSGKSYVDFIFSDKIINTDLKYLTGYSVLNN